MTRYPTKPLTDDVNTPFVRPGLLSWVVVPKINEPIGAETVTDPKRGGDIVVDHDPSVSTHGRRIDPPFH